jgi:hypothetical protein
MVGRHWIWGKTINKDQAFTDCVVLEQEAFDPDAVFLDDIVDDDVLPYLSLAVDGLTTYGEQTGGKLEMRPEDAAVSTPKPSTSMPATALDPEVLEVYGWESTLWRKLRGYLGF